MVGKTLKPQEAMEATEGLSLQYRQGTLLSPWTEIFLPLGLLVFILPNVLSGETL